MTGYVGEESPGGPLELRLLQDFRWVSVGAGQPAGPEARSGQGDGGYSPEVKVDIISTNQRLFFQHIRVAAWGLGGVGEGVLSLEHSVKSSFLEQKPWD